ncbi:MAG TPA: hypothetical protein VFE58_01425 [Tepidisphaeraceae bacterium]|jgi:hypothetical protein|nr:hypothetical protein [Tepidisphaeraceae bacterium]
MMQPNAPESAQRPPVGEDAPASAKEAFAEAGARLSEIKDYALYLLSAKVDQVTSSVKAAIWYAMVLMLVGIAGAGILVTAAVLMMMGIADGLTVLFGGRVWLADLVTGVVVLGLVIGSAYLVVGKMIGMSRAATRERYAAMKREQFARHGHDVHERATAAK